MELKLTNEQTLILQKYELKFQNLNLQNEILRKDYQAEFNNILKSHGLPEDVKIQLDIVSGTIVIEDENGTTKS